MKSDGTGCSAQQQTRPFVVERRRVEGLMIWSTCRPWPDVRADTARIAVGELPRERLRVPAAAGALLGRVRAAEAP